MSLGTTAKAVRSTVMRLLRSDLLSRVGYGVEGAAGLGVRGSICRSRRNLLDGGSVETILGSEAMPRSVPRVSDTNFRFSRILCVPATRRSRRCYSNEDGLSFEDRPP